MNKPRSNISTGLNFYANYKLSMMCCTGILIFIIGGIGAKFSHNLLKWKTVTAKVITPNCQQNTTMVSHGKNQPAVPTIRHNCNLDIEFKDHTGQTIKTMHQKVNQYVAYTPGQEIKIKYNPANPKEVMNEKGALVFYGAALMSFIGLLMFIIGIFGLIYCFVDDNDCAAVGGIFAAQEVVGAIRSRN